MGWGKCGPTLNSPGLVVVFLSPLCGSERRHHLQALSPLHLLELSADPGTQASFYVWDPGADLVVQVPNLLQAF